MMNLKVGQIRNLAIERPGSLHQAVNLKLQFFFYLLIPVLLASQP